MNLNTTQRTKLKFRAPIQKPSLGAGSLGALLVSRTLEVLKPRNSTTMVHDGALCTREMRRMEKENPKEGIPRDL